MVQPRRKRTARMAKTWGRVRPRLVYVFAEVHEGPKQQGACTKVLKNLGG